MDNKPVLNVNDIVVIRFTTWDLKENSKYKVAGITKDRYGNLKYQFKLNRKNATTVTTAYVEDIDKEISKHTYNQVMENKLYLVFERNSIYKLEGEK